MSDIRDHSIYDIIYSRDELIKRIMMLEDENAKLRECLHDFADLIENDDGFGVDQGWMLQRMRELGIEAES